MAKTKTGRQILFYGDSNTWGFDPADPYENRYPEKERWTGILGEKLGGEWSILCDAMNGRRLPDLRHDMGRLDNMLSRLDPGGIFALMLGTNDILITTDPDAEVPISRMKALLSFLCSRITPDRILVAAPPYIASESAADPLYRRYHVESARMNEGFRSLCERYEAGFLDAGAWDIPLCFDMVHFSMEGHRIFAQKMAQFLKDSFAS